MKANNRRQEVYALSCMSSFCKAGLGMLRKGETGRREAERGRHEAEQKKTRGMRFPVGPHSVSLGLGYFERVKLSHSIIKLTTNLHD
ncbi:hypothetical protein T4C_1377 [Trichinella pseudospiralis]|uniref:Uncharacterized protein n=1 Tax=Trichinella pseudospiralis TaxID=6337 RepID=A0A0V1JY41_TRIPS|nr:hypothetical protein T4C_1377 [Trichinella pseudospiralis]